jgi:tripartite-type tricarboxylate transporter receptor subunit TctC
MKTAIVLLSMLSTTVLPQHAAMAQEHYPSRPIKVIVPYPAGGTMDATARLVTDKVGAAIGGAFYIENAPGAAGSLGARAVAQAAPDGYTLLWMNQDFVVQPLIKRRVPYEAFKGFVPIALLGQAPEAILVHPSVPAKTLDELIALLKANPGKYSYASPGFGTTPHLAGERLFKITNHLDVAHVPFQGIAAVNATLGGHTQILLITIGTVADHVKGGSLRAIAVASPNRWPAFPDVPTMTEAGLANHDAEFFVGVMAPAGTPNPIIELLTHEIAKALADKEIKIRFDALGLQPIGSTPTEFAAKLRDASQNWAKVVVDVGIKVD